VLQQRQPHVEASPGVGMRGSPAIDDGKRSQSLGPAPCQGESDKRPQRVADEMGRPGIAGIEHGQRLIRHCRNAVVCRELAAIAAGAGLVVGDHAIALT
jgi:hypothetical protein